MDGSCEGLNGRFEMKTTKILNITLSSVVQQVSCLGNFTFKLGSMPNTLIVYELLQQMDEGLGKNAATIYRDRKTGKIRDFESEKLEKIEKRRKEDEKMKQYHEWGKG